jgi:hypothetical protein
MNQRISKQPSNSLPVQVNSSGDAFLGTVSVSSEVTVEALGHVYRATGDDLLGSVLLVVAQIAEHGHALHCCTTCRYFGMSGMARESTGGKLGYCMLEGPPDTRWLTHVLHVCPFWTIGPLDERRANDDFWRNYPRSKV